MYQFLKFIFGIKLFMFWTVFCPSSGVFLRTHSNTYRSAVSLQAASGMILIASCQQTCMTYTTAVCTVKNSYDGQRNCPKHVEFFKFISVFNQLDAQNLFWNKFYFMSLHVSSTCAHHQEVKIALRSLWYHHTYGWPGWERTGWNQSSLKPCTRRPPIGVMTPEAV